MYGLNKIVAIALAVTIGVAAVIGVTLGVINSNKNASIQKSNQTVKTERSNQQLENSSSGQDETNANSDSNQEKLTFPESKNDDIPDAYYKGTVTITEDNTLEKKAQVSLNGGIKSTFTSEEILYYENQTKKCYIIARKLHFESEGVVLLKHEGGAFSNTQNMNSLGNLYEYYGHIIKSEIKSSSNPSLPVRIDVKEGKIFTVVPTKKNDWVATVTGKDVTVGPPMVFPPDSLELLELNLIPGSNDIFINRSYHASESVLDEYSGMTVKPRGTFDCRYKQITEDEAMVQIAIYQMEELDKEKNSTFNPEEKDNSDNSKNVEVSQNKSLPLPEGYPQDVVPISNGAFIAISETVPGENGKKGYNVTLKMKQSKEETLQNYLKLLKNSTVLKVGNLTTISGEKGKYEYNVIIQNNTLGGSEKTMVQIVINPFED